MCNYMRCSESMDKINKYTVGSLFAGIGGICLGLKNAGFSISWANEIDKNACITYRENFPDHKLYEVDINKLNPYQLKNVDVITSGFPCQAFSIAGYRKGFSDSRGNLFFKTAEFIEKIQPEAFLLENVKNIRGHDEGRTFNTIRDMFEAKLNYSFIDFILNSKDYGNVPQTRERMYIVGFKNEAEYSKNSKLKKNDQNTRVCTLNFKIPDKIPLTKSIHDLILKNKQDKKYYYSSNHPYYPELSEKIRSRNTIYQWRRIYVRENKSNVCPTLTANMGTGGHNVPIVKDDYGIRKLIPLECAKFQGFRSDFILPECIANSHLYKQIGNSVTVPVIERIASEINRVLKLKHSENYSYVF